MSKKYGPTYLEASLGPSARPAQLNTRESFLCFNTLWGTSTVDPTSRSRPRFGLPWRRLHFHLTPSTERLAQPTIETSWALHMLTFTGKKDYLAPLFKFTSFQRNFGWVRSCSHLFSISIFLVWSSYRSSYNYPRLLCISVAIYNIAIAIGVAKKWLERICLGNILVLKI